jgi:DNA uptake protein ComE-like DNA-binding protein
MVILYYLDTPYMVAEWEVAGKLAQGFSRTPLTPPTAPPMTPAASPIESEDLININTCTAAELTAIKGIGVATAAEIMNGRPYESLEPLKSDSRLVPHLSKFTV